MVGTQARHCGSCHQPGSATAGQVEAIYQALKSADDAYIQAEDAIALGSEKRLIMTQQEEILQKANTPLIEARALQHTVSLATSRPRPKSRSSSATRRELRQKRR